LPTRRKPEDVAPAARPTAPPVEVEEVVRGEHRDPHHVLGAHIIGEGDARTLAIRVWHPRARQVSVAFEGDPASLPAMRIHDEGFFEATRLLPGDAPVPPYRLHIVFDRGQSAEIHDPYSFPPLLSDFDLYLMGEGTHYEKYEKLGAHVVEVNGVGGTGFAVWAPNARRVSVVGDFNQWDGRVHPMRMLGSSGVWEIFLPGVGEGAIYKFEILTALGPVLKSDPYGFAGEFRPATGSVVCNIDRYKWNDDAWVDSRERQNWLASPISIYEVHAASWKRNGKSYKSYRELAAELIPYVKQLGYTHIELLPVMEFPYDGSWGYQTVGYFAATSRFGSPTDLMYFIDQCHAANIGVILDWTPAHFPRDAHGLAFFDGTHLYNHADPRRGAHPDWGTLVFNYGRTEVQNYLIANALFWLDKYHADGLRVDAVASMLYLDYSRKPGEWLPNQFGGRENLEAIAFLRRMNEVVHARHPGVLTIAEESTSWPMVSRPTYLGGLGFSLKWNMGWMHDTLDFFAKDPVFRKFHHTKLTFSMLYAFSENFVLPFSHDEVVHLKRSMLAKMPGDMWQMFASLRLLYAYQYGHPGKKMLFMGGELAQWTEWNHDTQLDWMLLDFPTHRGVQRLVGDLNRLYTSEPSLHEVDFEWLGFEWMDCNDADASTLSFIRRAKNGRGFVLAVYNFTPVVRTDYRVAVPQAGFYEEILNTDAAIYGGSNVGNVGGVLSEPIPWLGKEHSLKLTLPPLGALFFKRKP